MKIKKYVYFLLVVVLMSSATIFTGCFNVNTTQAQEYTIEVTNSNQGGSAYGSGKYAQGETITIFALANDGYEFVKWDDGNTNSIRSITVLKNSVYRAEFKTKTIVNQIQYRLKKVDISISSLGSGVADDVWLEQFKLEDNQRYSFINANNGYTTLMELNKKESFAEPHNSASSFRYKSIVICPEYNFVYDKNEIANFRINLFVRGVTLEIITDNYIYNLAGVVSAENDIKQINFANTHYLELSYDNSDSNRDFKFSVSVKLFFDEI